MALAKFHSFRGEKSALILVKANAFVMQYAPVYVPKEAITEANQTPDAEGKYPIFNIPDGFKLAPMVDAEGNVCRTKPDAEGVVQELHVLAY